MDRIETDHTFPHGTDTHDGPPSITLSPSPSPTHGGGEWLCPLSRQRERVAGGRERVCSNDSLQPPSAWPHSMVPPSQRIPPTDPPSVPPIAAAASPPYSGRSAARDSV